MIPGLILTVGLVAQSFAGLVSSTPRNPDVPRFVNIGDEIIQSATAQPVASPTLLAPDAAPACDATSASDAVSPTDGSPSPSDASADDTEMTDVPAVEPVIIEPVVVIAGPSMHRFRSRPRPQARARASAVNAVNDAFRSATRNNSLPTVLLPPMPTVMLPPRPTVMLPPLPTVVLPPSVTQSRSR